MPYNQIDPRGLKRVLHHIQEAIYTPVADLTVRAWVTPEPVPFSERTRGQQIDLQPGDVWGKLWDCAWFHFEGRVDPAQTGANLVLLIDVNGELCLVDEEGNPRQGLTNINSEFDFSLGKPGKRVVRFANPARGDEIIDLWGDAGCNDLFGRFRSGTLKEAQIAICHEETRQLYYDYEVLLELAEQLPEESAQRKRLLRVLSQAATGLMTFTDSAVQQARNLLAPELARRGGDSPVTVSAIGHAHIDLAWLWPLRETYRKGARTFSTALRMMEQYPDYVFGASQPQLYQWMKDRHPKLYEEIRQRIAEGRWEAQGAMWVEPDSNIAGGEALVRQVLYGKRFFQQEFGKDMKVLWVPDIFGYSASLPQILKKSGVDYMMTQKLSWNVHNTHPHHTFFWEGIDGSRVLTHMPPEDTYNSPGAPRSIKKIERTYIDANVSDHALLLFGIGDGGGGPGEEHLERLKREKNLLGLLPVQQEPSLTFFQKLSEQTDGLATWRGELYLERHQGTLTSQARNKRYNRKLERALRELEFAATLHTKRYGGTYPRTELEEIWKEVLLYQFHDILPGSSITRVYTESLDRYAVLLARVESMIDEHYGAIAAQIRHSADPVVFNSLPWERTEWMNVGGRWQRVTVPPLGFVVVDGTRGTGPSNVGSDALYADEHTLENELLRVEFGEDGAVLRVIDKRLNRDVLVPGESGNQFALFHDPGDAWDFPETYRESPAGYMSLREVHVTRSQQSVALTKVYRFGDSELRQQIRLQAGVGRVDFDTDVNWRERKTMLRTAFPLNVHSESVNCEIQFGHVKRSTHRNTSWDAARDEICAHQWIDLSEPDYGVALLNDCKYGHRAHENVLDIHLLRSPGYPDPEADAASHRFMYSLLPHQGNFVDATVYRDGYNLNVPLRVSSPGGDATRQDESGTPTRFSWFTVNTEHVMVEAVKVAEDDDDVIVRLYEAGGTHQQCLVQVNPSVEAAWETDLLEGNHQPLTMPDSNTIPLAFGPFEIKTLKLKFS